MTSAGFVDPQHDHSIRDRTAGRGRVTDEQLTAFAWPDATPEEAAILCAKTPPEKRAVFEQMAFVADELNAGRVPPGVMVD